MALVAVAAGEHVTDDELPGDGKWETVSEQREGGVLRRGGREGGQ